MKHLQAYSQFLNEKKPAGAPDWHDSDAPDAEGRFKELSPKKLAAWLIKTRNKDLRKITGSLNQQIVFNRNEDPEYADKMEKTRQEVYKQLGREDLMDSKQTQDEMKHIKPLNEAPAFGSHDKGDYSDEMSYGQLERCMDYSKMIRERIKAGQSLDPWMHSQIAVAENELNSVFDALDGDDGVVESERDWNDKRRGPHPYTATLSDEDEKEKEAHEKITEVAYFTVTEDLMSKWEVMLKAKNIEKRKNNLKNILSEKDFDSLQLDPTSRAEDLSVEDFLKIVNYVFIDDKKNSY